MTKKCGYLHILDRKTGKDSFVRQLSADRYPRFHLYIDESQADVIFDLHLDQSKTRYQDQKAHRAEYESEEVKTELTRIYQTISQFQT
jgi:RecB family exonuclease